MINANLLPPLISLLKTAEFKIKKEACWAISNATSQKTARPDQVQYLVEQGCIPPLCDLLEPSQEARIILVALDAIENILEVGEAMIVNDPDHINRYALFIEEAGGMEKIDDLQQHEQDDVYQRCKTIIDKFYGREDELEEINDTGFTFEQQGFQVPQGGFQFQ